MERRMFEQYQDRIARLFPETLMRDSKGKKILSKPFTFQVTDKCNLCCTYCYQGNKGERRMSFETARKAVDRLLANDNMNDYITVGNSPAVIFEFIGGEPFLEIGLIGRICDYIVERLIVLEHPWAARYMFSICSNGVLHMTPEVQAFLNKYQNKLSYSITIDGNKELHDSCRIFPDGSGSYDLAIEGAKDWIRRGGYLGSKITIAPDNLAYLYDAVVHFISLGYKDINANVVYEEGWNIGHAGKFYIELKKVADYFIDNGLVEDVYISLFVETFFKPKDEDDVDNWCGGTGVMLSVDPDGYYYPCIRYMESSLGSGREPYCIGHVDTGIAVTQEEQQRIKCLDCITRKTQSTEECFSCPIADGCSWCSAYNYQVNGTPDSRVTYICCMHKARSLANVYFWNRYYQKNKISKVFEMHCPKEWALEIISEHEYGMLEESTGIKKI